MPRDSRFSQPFRFLKISRPSLGLFIPLMGLLALLLIAACGGDDPTQVPQSTAAVAQPTSAPVPTAMPAPTSRRDRISKRRLSGSPRDA